VVETKTEYLRGKKMIFGGYEPPARRNFTITTKRIEWISSAGGDVGRYLRDKKFVKTSKCRRCKRKLVWGDHSYEFDHKDNNSSNNSQRNCYLVCRICHGKATKIDKRAIRDVFGGISGYQTIKKKVSYKKPKTKKASRKVVNKKPKKTTIKKAVKRKPKRINTKKVASKTVKKRATKRVRARRRSR